MQSHFLQALGWATLNSLWQMALLWATFCAVNHTFKLSASRKYQASVGAMLIGFAVGYHDRRVRGQMNALLHPADAGDVILGFVVPDR